MTNHPTVAAPTRRPARTAYRLTAVLSLLAGLAFVVDTVTIAVINGPFDPLDSILFFAGLSLMFATGVALAVATTTRWQGVGRVGVGVALFLAFAVGLGAISMAFDTLGRHVFSDSNVGLHEEWSFFSIGVCLLVVTLWSSRRAT